MYVLIYKPLFSFHLANNTTKIKLYLSLKFPIIKLIKLTNRSTRPRICVFNFRFGCSAVGLVQTLAREKAENQRRESKSALSEFRRDLEVKSHGGIQAEIQKTKSKNQS